MSYRKLRIAWSVAWGVVAVLLVVLWMRSLWKLDLLIANLSDQYSVSLQSADSRVTVSATKQSDDLARPLFIFGCENLRSGMEDIYCESPLFGVEKATALRITNWEMWMPHIFPAALFAATALLPWLTPRFSLRTLLIATTLVAVVLGVVVWLR